MKLINSFYFIAESNLMGAAEWTGYTNAPTYAPYSTNAALPQPATTTASSYGYDSNVGMADHHSNFHIPTGTFGRNYII